MLSRYTRFEIIQEYLIGMCFVLNYQCGRVLNELLDSGRFSPGKPRVQIPGEEEVHLGVQDGQEPPQQRIQTA